MACGGTRSEGRRASASSGCCARATRTRSSRAARSGSTRCTAGSTTTSTASTTASRTSRRVTVEEEADVWKDYTTWPIHGTQNVDVFLRGDRPPPPRARSAAPPAARPTRWLHRHGEHQRDDTLMNTPTGAQTNRRVFLSRAADQGRPPVRHGRASTSPAALGGHAENLGALIVDYGAGTQVTRSGEGISTPRRAPAGATPARRGGRGLHRRRPACTASAREIDTACYLEVDQADAATSPQWRVTRGIARLRRTATRCGTRTRRRSRSASPTATSSRPCRPSTSSRPATRSAIVIVGQHRRQRVGHRQHQRRRSRSTRAVEGDAADPGRLRRRGLGRRHRRRDGRAGRWAPSRPTSRPPPTDATGTTVTYTLPTATDNEDPNPVVTCDPASGSKFAVGTTTVHLHRQGRQRQHLGAEDVHRRRPSRRAGQRHRRRHGRRRRWR